MDSATVPKPLGTDEEDVAWALATAEAMWARGDKADAIKWIRKAAEAASEADDILRAADLASAAADLANLIEPKATAPLAKTMQSGPSPVRAKAPPPPKKAPTQASPAPPKASPAPPQAAPKTQAMPRAGVSPARVAPLASGGRSRSDAPPRAGSVRPPPAAKKRENRLDITAVSALTPDEQKSPPQKTQLDASALDTGRRLSSSEPPDDWETQEPPTAAAPDLTDLRSPAPTPPEFVDPVLRGLTPGGAAFRPKVSSMTEVDRVVPDLGARAVRLQASQAFHVVLWKDARGVHVAPSGTVVSAITVDAILIALDPSADLSAWLTPSGTTKE